MDREISNIKERILYISDCKGINKESFFNQIDVTYGSFKGKQKESTLKSDTIERLLTIYSDIDANWLLTGKGNMFKKQSANNEAVKPINEVVPKTKEVELLEKQILLLEENKSLTEKENKRLEQENKEYQAKNKQLQEENKQLQEENKQLQAKLSKQKDHNNVMEQKNTEVTEYIQCKTTC